MKYTKEDHQKAFELFLELGSLGKVASVDGMPNKHTLSGWAKPEFRCECPYHNWYELIDTTANPMLKHQESLTGIKSIKEKAGGDPNKVKDRIAKAQKAIKQRDKDRIKVIKQDLWKDPEKKVESLYLLDKLKDEILELLHDNKLKPFQTMADAIKSLDLIVKNERLILGEHTEMISQSIFTKQEAERQKRLEEFKAVEDIVKSKINEFNSNTTEGEDAESSLH